MEELKNRFEGKKIDFFNRLLGAPGCNWNINIIFSWGVIVDTGGCLMYSVFIPNDSSLAGASFYDQAAISDPIANQLGIVTTWSNKWTIGNPMPVGGTRVVKHQDTGCSPTGTMVRCAVVAKFN